jgi:hypothetical protein
VWNPPVRVVEAGRDGRLGHRIAVGRPGDARGWPDRGRWPGCQAPEEDWTAVHRPDFAINRGGRLRIA